MAIGIALGSNLGESEAILTRSIQALQKIHHGELTAFLTSSFYTTTPVDCPPKSPFFLNAVIQLETSIAPLDVLDFLQSMEREAGRPCSRPYHAPRTLDLDLLYYNSMTILAPRLQVPHPRIRERLFVLRPLVEINPHLILPGWQKTAEQYLHLKTYLHE
jgi:2-amino-4-hydroxy-6-hydroxymethyldihydropteridine diphosphokinase